LTQSQSNYSPVWDSLNKLYKGFKLKSYTDQKGQFFNLSNNPERKFCASLGTGSKSLDVILMASVFLPDIFSLPAFSTPPGTVTGWQNSSVILIKLGLLPVSLGIVHSS